jgi:DNA polymerase-3 subunit delta
MKSLLEQGVRLDQVLDQERVWDKRKRPVTDTLSRLSGAQLRGAMIQLAKADRLVKGAEKGNAWDTLVQIALTITGTSVFTETA